MDRVWCAALGGSCLALAAAPSSAGPTDFFELFALDAGVGDQFGWSVDVNGTLAVVGSCLDDELGLDAGSAYLFDAATGAQLGKLLPIAANPFDGIGCAVAINGSFILVGADGVDGFDMMGNQAPDEGAAYVFNPGSPGNAPVTVSPPDLVGGDGFGFSVDVGDGAFAGFGIVGAPYDDGLLDDDGDAGAAYFVNLSVGGSGITFRADDQFRGDLYGYSVGFDQPRVVVGAPFVGSGADGAVYVHVRPFDENDPGSPDGDGVDFPELEINSPTGQVGEQFGTAVAIDGTIVVVGAPGNARDGLFAGAVYVYDVTDINDPVLVEVLRHPDGRAFDFFGASVDISGDRIVVGAPFDEDESGTGAGSVWVFEAATGWGDATYTGATIIPLGICSGAEADNFGRSVAIDSGVVVAGVPGDDFAGMNAGAAAVYPAATALFDCNGNGEPDTCELADDPGLDCWPPAMGGNGVLDECDIFADPSLDCDGNGRVDECEILDDPDLDCDFDGVLDVCQIVLDPSLDCNGNLVIDSCELGPDTDCAGVDMMGNPTLGADGILDECQIAAGDLEDCNMNGVPDICDLDTGTSEDCWPVPLSNGIPDECDIAADPSIDCDGNGRPDDCDVLDDPMMFDCDGNGEPDSCQILDDPALDCNGDGILDACQSGDPMLDCDANGIVDACEIVLNPLLDCDDSGTLDFCDVRDGIAEDCNNNERIDSCDIAANPTLFDCDGNDLIDSCEIAANPSLDMNVNGTLDVCEAPPCPPDLAPPFGVLDLNDLNFFVGAFLLGDPIADFNSDGVVDLDDIISFLAAYNAGCP
jgi:hypothetical protein